ncbi:MAG: phosphate acyltransferase PlsX [Puniceicoccales bacterium]|jgi:glycerol-3-phosphate acyltransferase PlsX|nr:phosphate acyltransferase PlsX [Puniceicoccales bacterium]
MEGLGSKSRRGPVIAVDVMGADRGPGEVIGGVALALKTGGSDFGKIILVGRSEVLEAEARRAGIFSHPKVERFHAGECVEMHEKAVQSLKQKKDASMFRAIDLVKIGEADAVLSCGNTGSLMAGGTLKLRPVDGLYRPALATVIPSRFCRFILVDAGANPESDVRSLVHNAILGSHYAHNALQKDRPRVGLLTIGTEEGKGNEVINQAHACLRKLGQDRINYQGLIEGFHVFDNRVDVVVCDGFVGNVVLKTCESLFKNLKDYLTAELLYNWWRKLGAFMTRGAFRAIGKQLDPDRYGGAPLLGLNGWVVKAHGSSSRKAVMNALIITTRGLKNQKTPLLIGDLMKANGILEGVHSF